MTLAKTDTTPRRRGPIRAWHVAPYLFVLPNMAIFGLFTIYPAINMFNISLYDSNDGRRFRFVGPGNYTEILTDAQFGQIALNTVIFTVAFVVLTTVFATLFAVMLNDAFPGRGFFRAVIFVPSLLSAVVVGLLWEWILDRSNGLLNITLGAVSDVLLNITRGAIGLPQPGWLVEGNWAMASVIFVGLWINTGFYALIMLSGLQGIDPSLYEAARVDGATRWQQFSQLTWPLLRPTTLVVVILSMISGFQSFDFIWTLTGGGPVGATTLMVQYIYERAFASPIRYGLASAGAVVLFITVFAFTALNFINGRRQDAA